MRRCDLVDEGLVAGGEVADHVGLMRGGAAGEHGGDERGSAGSADVAGEVGEAGDVVVLGLLYADVGDGVDGNEEEGEAGGLEDAQEDEASIADAEVHGVHRDERAGEHEEAVGDELARVDLADEEADDRHHGHHHEACGREDHAGELRGVAEQGLDELRDEDGGAVEGEAKHEHQDEADGEVAALEEGEIEDGAMVDA